MNAARLSALALIGALAAASLAQAQEAAPAAPPPGARAWDPAQMQARMEAKRAERTKALHDALNIQPNQESAFSAYAAAMKPNRGPGGWRGRDGKMGDDRATMAAMTTPQRLDFMAQKMDERMARMKDDFARREAATKTLYAQLNPDQKRTMDALPALRGGDGRHGGWGRGPGGPGGPGRG